MRVAVKSLLCLILAVSGWKAIQAIDEGEALTALKNLSSDCEPTPTEEDYKNIIRNEQDVPQSTKCYRLCLTKKLNLMKDCKIDDNNLISVMELVYNDKEDEIREIASVCNTKVECVDECSASHDYAMCILNEVKTRGWPIDPFTF